MTRSFASLVAPLCLVLALIVSGCGPARPVIPPGEIPAAPTVSSEDERYGQAVLGELSRQYPLSRDDVDINRVRDIVARLARTAHADQAPWNVYVLRGDSVVNAAATKGNYVFVWTGLLHVARTDGELATVLSHELGHLLAGHTQPTPAEEASSIIAQTTGQIAGQVVATQGPYGVLAGITGALVTEAIKAFAVNPESQRQELEADHIGFFLMSDAGYNPEEALAFWQRLSSAAGGGGGGLQFLSSHPANEERLAELNRLLPEARERYQRARTPAVQSRPSSRRRSNGEPDSFSFGKDTSTGGAAPSSSAPRAGEQQTPPPADRSPRSVREPIWIVVEPETPVFLTPLPGSSRVATLEAGTQVIIRERVGRFYEISSPVQGFVPGDHLSPP